MYATEKTEDREARESHNYKILHPVQSNAVSGQIVRESAQMWHALILRFGSAKLYCRQPTTVDVGAICSLCAPIVHSYRPAIVIAFVTVSRIEPSTAVLQTRIYLEYASECTLHGKM